MEITPRQKSQIIKNQNIMRTLLVKVALCATVLFAPTTAKAQGAEFKQLAQIKGVEVVHMDKKMINSAAKKGEDLKYNEITIAGGGSVLNYLDDVFLYRCEAQKGAEKLKKQVLKLLKNEKWQTLMDVAGDEGEKVKMCQTKEGEKNTNVFFVEKDDETVFVVMTGSLDLANLIEKYTNGDFGDFEEGDDEEED